MKLIHLVVIVGVGYVLWRAYQGKQAKAAAAKSSANRQVG